ncbi:HAMP domain-containing sensor histidine kinase [Cohnella fermenti]|uniref:histidine kinase n=1 Tax=Cohnella fermenti TaxID=2565925 RepID=A0A4S4BL03_9BACL|nr:HAMP domain-containing sensor histidine kinase [Cohnella fermenti]THF75335.1 HAMP domain-containing histidine kinase [Cohnella fermenti]
MSSPQRKSILYYWSIRYLTILFVSIVVLGLLAMYLFNWNALYQQKSRLQNIVRDIGAAAEDNGGRLPEVPDMERFLSDLAARHGLPDDPILFILDSEGGVVQQFPPSPPKETDQIAERMPEVLSRGAQIIALDAYEGRKPLFVGIQPIAVADRTAGYALYAVARQDVLDGIFAFRYPRIILLSLFMLLGWGIVYALTRRLMTPIREAAEAAKQIVAGNYDLHLDKEYKEKEIHELASSFKEMADRLSRLEALRTQLLAGVTHEFKTPVTSISGLLQAVRKKVVRGKEAEVFLDHCMNECDRLQKMVEDLLDFNSFAAGVINVRNEPTPLNETIAAMIDRWRCGQDRLQTEVRLEMAASKTNPIVFTDPTRLEQILVNLLNNAKDATAGEGSIRISVSSDPEWSIIRVEDTGCGIPAEEQKDIFEPFYRGAEKKVLIHGLGLGLPFSRLIARSLGGDLALKSSSASGSAFELHIPLSTAS